MKFHILDALRGVAVMLVFSHHLRSKDGFQELPIILGSLFNRGHIGVLIFFIISGFCIMSSVTEAVKNKDTAWRFLFKRAKRIYITFWFSVALVAIIPFLIQLVNSFNAERYISPFKMSLWRYQYLHYSLIDWIQTISLTKIFEDPNNIKWLAEKFNKLNGVYWSLAIEVQFYLVMFLALYFKKRLNLILIIVTIFSLLIKFVFPEYQLSGFFFYYWHFFAFGILLYFLFSYQIKPSSYPNFKKIFEILSLLIFCYLCISLMTFKKFRIIEFVILFLPLLWLLEVYERRYLKYLADKNIIISTLNLLGLISYSVYLIHHNLYYLVAACLKLIINNPGFISMIFAVLLTLVGCYLFYLVCEKPFYRRKIKVPPA